jgi:ribosomal protein L11 methyltransferase
VTVTALFAADADITAIRTGLGASTGLDPLLVAEKARIEPVADRAWEREWLKDFRPMRFGGRLWVCPGGQRPAIEPGGIEPIIVELDPGLAFGTGTHPTTALCLEWLDSGSGSWLREGDLIVDYGCGSGILAIAALKLGAGAAIAMDIDDQALLATQQNAERNELSRRVRVTADPRCDGARAQVLVANILAGPLIDLAATLAAHVEPGGRIALSGLLAEQADAVTAAYQPWFDIGLTGARDGWALLTGLRRGNKSSIEKRPDTTAAASDQAAGD